MKRIALAVVPLLMLMVSALPAGTLAQDATTLKVANDPNLGAILTGANGMTVYLFTKDTEAGKSSCYDQCATNWPPVEATDNMTLPDGVPGTLGTIERTDGTKQVTYNDIPLYYWIADKSAGDTTGQGVGNVWFVVSPGSALGPYATPPGKGTPYPASTLHVGFKPELGPYLTDAKGMTLYLFTKDTKAGESACYDKCAENWPIVPATAGVSLPVGVQGTLGSIDRTDGTKQLTYNDIPLYYWINDKAPGDTSGQEVGDVWYIVPTGAKLGDPPHETAEAEASPAASS